MDVNVFNSLNIALGLLVLIIVIKIIIVVFFNYYCHEVAVLFFTLKKLYLPPIHRYSDKKLWPTTVNHNIVIQPSQYVISIWTEAGCNPIGNYKE